MSIFEQLFQGTMEIAKLGTQSAAQKQMAKKRGKGRSSKKDPANNCTPCAAKAAGADMANSIWK